MQPVINFIVFLFFLVGNYYLKSFAEDHYRVHLFRGMSRTQIKLRIRNSNGGIKGQAVDITACTIDILIFDL